MLQPRTEADIGSVQILKAEVLGLNTFLQKKSMNAYSHTINRDRESFLHFINFHLLFSQYLQDVKWEAVSKYFSYLNSLAKVFKYSGIFIKKYLINSSGLA